MKTKWGFSVYFFIFLYELLAYNWEKLLREHVRRGKEKGSVGRGDGRKK